MLFGWRVTVFLLWGLAILLVCLLLAVIHGDRPILSDRLRDQFKRCGVVGALLLAACAYGVVFNSTPTREEKERYAAATRPFEQMTALGGLAGTQSSQRTNDDVVDDGGESDDGASAHEEPACRLVAFAVTNGTFHVTAQRSAATPDPFAIVYSSTDSLTNSWHMSGRALFPFGSRTLKMILPPSLLGVAMGEQGFLKVEPDANAWDLVSRESVSSASELRTAMSVAPENRVIEVSSGTYDVGAWSVLPTNAVLVTSPSGTLEGGVIFQSKQQGPMFLAPSEGSDGCVFQGIVFDLVAQGGFQGAFWLGGGLPWVDAPSSVTFRNCYFRMPNDGVKYHALLSYGAQQRETLVENCIFNASGANDVRALFGVNGARVTMRNTAFIGFDGGGTNVFVKTLEVGELNADAQISRVNTNESCRILGSIWDVVPADDRDFDGDGLSNFRERELGTDPLSPDSDGDGVSDGVEDDAGTDPLDRFSHQVLLRVSVTNTINNATLTNYCGFGSSEREWDAQPLLTCVRTGAFQLTTNAVRGLCVKAYTDLNRNGRYDELDDVILVQPIVSGKAMVELTLKLGDMDNDLSNDAQERADMTDPYSALSLVLRRSVRITDDDYDSNIADYYQVSATTNWEASAWIRMSSSYVDFVTSMATVDGSLYVHTFRDFNGNGVCDIGYDGYKRFVLVRGNPGVEFVIGDTDGDGVKDRLEIEEGSDYLDRQSYYTNADVYFELTDDQSSITNYIQATVDFPIPCTNQWQMFAGKVSNKVHLREAVTNGVFYGIYFRDVNGNGMYDADIDVFRAQSFGGVKSHDMCAVLMGDCDMDGVQDSKELELGTNPCDSREYCFNATLELGGLLSVQSDLRYEVLFGNAVLESGIATGRIFERSLLGLRTADAEKLTVRFWEDVNGNAAKDGFERETKLQISVDGYETVVKCRIPLGDFDGDGDGMADDWERMNRLNPLDKGDALEDPDDDGIINLHEYYARTNPSGEDGGSTAVYSFSHSIDDRIRTIPRKGKSKLASTSPFRLNVNCWEYGIESSSASPYNSTAWNTSCRAGTAISRRHIIFADHYRIAVGATIRFVGNDNVVYERTISDERYLANTDIMIASLSSDLPDAVVPAVILPGDYSEYIGDALRLPMLMYDYSEHSIVTDSNSIGYGATSADGLVPVDLTRKHYFEEVVLGDSGDPKYFVSGSTVILVCCLKSYGTGNSGVGPFVTMYKDRIQAMMDCLCPGYRLNEFDFSGFRRLDDEE